MLRSRLRLRDIVLALGVVLPAPLDAQASDSTTPEPIRDNSFLVEEAYNADDTRGRSSDLLLGGSAIWLARPRFNVMLEATHLAAREPVPGGATARSTTTIVSPGVRWAYDFASGLQIVPGLAMPIEVGRGDGERSLFLYLSFEHPFTRRAARGNRAESDWAGAVERRGIRE